MYVEGAQPGDALEVKILSIEFPLDYGYNGCSGFVRGNCDRTLRQKILTLDRTTHDVRVRPGIVIPLKPFFGSMGVAPAPASGRVSSGPPGGTPAISITASSSWARTLYIPVFVPGALFEIGEVTPRRATAKWTRPRSKPRCADAFNSLCERACR